MDRRLLVSFMAFFALTGTTMSQETKTSNNRIFEMRTYYAHPGRMTALDSRFRDHTCKLFEKHGIQLVGFWKPMGKADEVMVYILAYPSKEAADKSWKAFREDPVWLKAKEDSEKSGPIVKKVESVFLSPTDYSPIK
jgi:hypothetical protein